VHAWELRNNSALGAAWEVQMLANDELMLGKRCDSEPEARYVARAWRQDTERAGFGQQPG
jgi:hypothetical protein